jgi:uncharacterized membrane protein YhiD involved in acid resistance
MDIFESLDFSLGEVIIGLGLSAAMAFVLSLIYVKCGTSLSNRRNFSRNFFILSMTITLIISIVKSSLALSLGLVGALSIVRYRAAIKEPEELAYLFIAIAIGLGLGANMNALTVVSFLTICIVIIANHFFQTRLSKRTDDVYNLIINIPKSVDSTISLDAVLDKLEVVCDRIKLKRFEDSKEHLDISLLIENSSTESISNITQAVKNTSADAKVFFLDKE